MATRRMGMIGLLLALCLCIMTSNVQALSTVEITEPISTEKKCNLTISYDYENTMLADVPVRLYQVGSVSADAQYTLTELFQPTGIELNGIQMTDEWDVIRSTLEAQILADQIKPDFTAKSNQSGQVHFQSLELGLYLAVTENVIKDGVQYSFSPALVTLPTVHENGGWQYEVSVEPKAEAIPVPDSDEQEKNNKVKVVKLWKDEDNREKRPESITVEIFCDGKSYQIITLSEHNNWSYGWTAAADGADWMVAERDIPDGYTATVAERGTTFIVTNTSQDDGTTPEDGPGTGDTQSIFLYTMILFGAGAALILLSIVRKRD